MPNARFQAYTLQWIHLNLETASPSLRISENLYPSSKKTGA
jgi:hypothetical protein